MAAQSTIHDVTGRRLVSSIYSWDIYGGKPQITRKNRFVHFYLPRMWGGRPEAENWRPVAAASQIFFISRWHTSHHLNRVRSYWKSIRKLSRAPGIKLILKIVAFKWLIRKFLNIVADQMESLRHPQYAYWKSFFRVNVPLKCLPANSV
jgi:hypothetical protein